MQIALVILGIGLWLSVPQYVAYLCIGGTAPYYIAAGPLTIVWFIVSLLVLCIYMFFWGCDKANNQNKKTG